MGFSMVPFDALGLAAKHRSAEERARSVTGGSARFRLVAFLGSVANSTMGGEVKLISSMPPVLEGVAVEAALEGFGVRGPLQILSN